MKKLLNSKDNTYTLKEVILITVIFTIFFSVLSGITVYLLSDKNIIASSNVKDITNTYNEIKNSYYETVDEEELKNSAINGMMNFLNEKYSIYMDKDSTDSLNKKLDGNYKGIGISVSKIKDDIKIVEVFEGTPASNAGLIKNDIIKKVDDLEVTKDTSLNDVVSLIKEKDKISISVLRDNEIKEFKIDVKNIEQPVTSSDVYELDNKKIGYIYLSTFSENSYSQFRKKLIELENKGIDSLIVDVRSNTGGYLESANDIASMFIKKGKALYTLSEKNNNKVFYDETVESRDYDIVVLVDSITASASEVLASALKESYGATIIGTKTYGKGRVQQTSSLSNKTMIKYTSALWLTPNGNSIDGVGIIPGIEVKLSKKYAENPSDKTDDQLQKALKFLSSVE